MPATVHVIARVRARAAKEDALKVVLSALVRPSRRELACFQYDLLQSATDPREFCFVERWESQKALDQHAASEHVRHAGEQMADLVEAPPEIQRYLLV
jgi:quinol monooxygenase YgiN